MAHGSTEALGMGERGGESAGRVWERELWCWERVVVRGEEALKLNMPLLSLTVQTGGLKLASRFLGSCAVLSLSLPSLFPSLSPSLFLSLSPSLFHILPPNPCYCYIQTDLTPSWSQFSFLSTEELTENGDSISFMTS